MEFGFPPALADLRGCRQRLGEAEMLPSALRLPPELVSHRREDQRQEQTERVPEPLGQIERVIDACLSLIRIAKHPPGPRIDKAGANSPDRAPHRPTHAIDAVRVHKGDGRIGYGYGSVPARPGRN